MLADQDSSSSDLRAYRYNKRSWFIRFSIAQWVSMTLFQRARCAEYCFRLDPVRNYFRRISDVLINDRNACCSHSELITQLRQFWETKKVPLHTHLTEEEQRCEDYFLKIHTCDSSGRYIVRLPFKEDSPIDLGLSPPRSVYCNTLKRLDKNESLVTEYNAFLNEYASLNHRALVQWGVLPSLPSSTSRSDSRNEFAYEFVFNTSHKISNSLS